MYVPLNCHQSTHFILFTQLLESESQIHPLLIESGEKGGMGDRDEMGDRGETEDRGEKGGRGEMGGKGEM